MAKGLYNLLTDANDADAAGIIADINEFGSLAEYLAFGEEKFNHPGLPQLFSKFMADKGIDISGYGRKSITPETLANYDLVVNIADRAQTPDWLRGDNVIWWEVGDPGRKIGGDEDVLLDALLGARDEIEKRVKKLIETERAGDDFHELDDNIDEWRNGRWRINGQRGVVVFFVTDEVRKYNWPAHLLDMDLKDRFHISLVMGAFGPDLVEPLSRICEEVEDRLVENPPRLTGEFRLVKKGDAETIIAQVEFPVVEIWLEKVSTILPNALLCPPHVTLYLNKFATPIAIMPEGFVRMSPALPPLMTYFDETHELDAETLTTLRNVWEEKANQTAKSFK